MYNELFIIQETLIDYQNIYLFTHLPQYKVYGIPYTVIIKYGILKYKNTHSERLNKTLVFMKYVFELSQKGYNK